MAEFEIILQLCAPPHVDREALEANMFEVLTVAEERSDDALGPVVALNFETSEIELAFIVEAENVQGAHEAVARVLRAIDEHTDVNLTARVATTSATTETHPAGTLCAAV